MSASVIVEVVRKVSIPGGPCYNCGERVAFDPEVAQDLIERGAAVAVPEQPQPKQVSAPPRNKMLQSPPSQKGGRVRERTRLHE